MPQTLAEACRAQIKQAPDPSVIPWVPLPIFSAEAIKRQKEAEAEAERKKQEAASAPQEKKVIGTSETRNFFAKLSAGHEKQAAPAQLPSNQTEEHSIRQESKPPSFPFASHRAENSQASPTSPSNDQADTAPSGKSPFQNLLNHNRTGQNSLFSSSGNSASAFGSVSSGRSKPNKPSGKSSEKSEKKRHSGSSGDIMNRLKQEFLHND